VTLHYGRRRVCLRSSTLIAAPRPRFAIHGTGGSFVKFGLDPQEEALKQGNSPAQPHWGEEPKEAWGTITQGNGKLERAKYTTLAGCYPEYYNNVYRAITGKEELAVKPEQSRNVIRLIELAEQSAREKRLIPVTLHD